ncbi:MAG: HAD family hydrolase [Oscillospiraceae bacterium]|nr:HAD family hydrolase [Oscillospiraceae bacterium]
MNYGIIFDLDGTLWDSSEQVAVSWSEALARRPETDRQVTGEDMRGFMGKTMETIAELMLPELEPSLRIEIMHECERVEQEYLEKHGGVLFPDLERELERLCGLGKLFIVSNCQSGYIETFLEYHKLGKYFADFECPGGTGFAKAENIRIVMERNKLDKAVYVGDTQGDLDASDSAGVPFIHAAYGFGSVDRDVPAVKSFSEVYDAAKNILGV